MPRRVTIAIFRPSVDGSSNAPKQTGQEKALLWLTRSRTRSAASKENNEVFINLPVEYIVNNPVRKGLAREWEEYPYAGSFVYELWPSS